MHTVCSYSHVFVPIALSVFDLSPMSPNILYFRLSLRYMPSTYITITIFQLRYNKSVKYPRL